MAEHDDQAIRRQVAARLRGLRKAAGYTLDELAPRLGVDKSRLSRMERGEQGISTIVLRRAALTLDVPMDEFFAAETKPRVLFRAEDEQRASDMLAWARELSSDLALVRRYAADRGV